MPTFDLSALENDFKQPLVKQSFMSLYQCLGFITAIASSPDQVKPSEWIKELMLTPDQSPEFSNQEEAKNFSANLVGWWSRCISIFDHGGKIELPEKLGLTPTGRSNKALQEFAAGYLKGYSWLSKTWQMMLPADNKEAHRSLVVLGVILARFVDEKNIAKEESALFEQLPDMAGCLKALPNLLSAVGMLGLDLATQKKTASSQPQKNQKTQGSATPVRNQERGVGRNDPCPCGSGKKFKKCCLH